MKIKFFTAFAFAALSILCSCTPEGSGPEFRSVIRLWEVHHMDDTLQTRLMESFLKYPKACDEVWFCGPETDGYASEEFLSKLRKAADDVKALGIIPSYQDISIGHPEGKSCPAGKNALGYRTAVGWDGNASPHQTCPRDTAFASFYATRYSKIAEAIHPDNVMIDDDLRLTEHYPMGLICFCDECISGFNRRFSHDFTRPALKAALESNAAGIRTEWIEFSQESLALFARRIAEEVHKVSPETHMGLQHPAFHYQLMEGWDWNKIFDAMRDATGNSVSSRPGHGEYNDHSPRGLIKKAYMISRQIARLKGDFHLIFPEIEGYDHRATGKSPQGVCTETMMYLAMGANSMSYALICNNCEPMSWYADNYFRYLDRYHDFFSSFVAHNRCTEGAGIDDYVSPSLVFRDTPDWMTTYGGGHSAELAALGIPFTPEARMCTAGILDALNIRSIGPDEFGEVTEKHGTVVDSYGWEAIVAKGFNAFLHPTDIPDALPEGTRCFITEGGKRFAVIADKFRYSLTGAQRQELLRVFDWASDSRMSVLPESFSQCVTIPRVSSVDGYLRSVTYVNATITDQENITLRLRNCPDKAVITWEDVNGSHRLKVTKEGNDCLVTIPFVKAWDSGWIKVSKARRWKL